MYLHTFRGGDGGGERGAGAGRLIDGSRWGESQVLAVWSHSTLEDTAVSLQCCMIQYLKTHESKSANSCSSHVLYKTCRHRNAPPAGPLPVWDDMHPIHCKISHPPLPEAQRNSGKVIYNKQGCIRFWIFSFHYMRWPKLVVQALPFLCNIFSPGLWDSYLF